MLDGVPLDGGQPTHLGSNFLRVRAKLLKMQGITPHNETRWDDIFPLTPLVLEGLSRYTRRPFLCHTHAGFA